MSGATRRGGIPIRVLRDCSGCSRCGVRSRVRRGSCAPGDGVVPVVDHRIGDLALRGREHRRRWGGWGRLVGSPHYASLMRATILLVLRLGSVTLREGLADVVQDKMMLVGLGERRTFVANGAGLVNG